MSEMSITEFAEKVGGLMPFIMREFMKHHVGTKTNITMPQFFVLEFLHRSGECKMGDIAKFISVTTAAITGIVDRLVRDGYVVRASDARDRRIVKIKLTAKGVRVVKDMTDRRNQISVKMFGKISQEERMQYLNILTRIKDKLQEEE